MSTITLAPVRLDRARTASQRPRTQGRVRLTRRGRVVVVLFALLVVAVVAVFVAAGSAATDERGGAAQVDIVTVAPGETLWAIASGVAAESGDDTREVMQQIRDLNALDGSTLYAGQDLRVPSH